MLRTPR